MMNDEHNMKPEKSSIISYNSSHRSHGNIPRSTIFTIILALLLSTGAGFFGGWLEERHNQISASGNTTANQRIVLNESQVINQVAKNVSPSVVSVDVTSSASPQSTFLGFDSSPAAQESAGTGVIISSSGIIITNRHVVPAGTNTVSVTLADGTQLNNVSVIGRTTDTDPLDVAFLKINDAKGEKLTAATLGDSSKVQIGDRVVAIGNALGQFQNTVTSGIISGFGRSVQASDSTGSASESLQDLMQTDAAINEGNSGGPLVDINSEVIGINTAVAGGQAQNIGFTMPINDLKGLINGVLNSGKIERPYLGVRYIPITAAYASHQKLPVKQGAYIAPSSDGTPSIISGSPAEKAGLKEGDIITQVDGTTIDNSSNSLTSLLSSRNVGDTVSLTVIRGGKTITIQATLANAPTQ